MRGASLLLVALVLAGCAEPIEPPVYEDDSRSRALTPPTSTEAPHLQRGDAWSVGVLSRTERFHRNEGTIVVVDANESEYTFLSDSAGLTNALAVGVDTSPYFSLHVRASDLAFVRDGVATSLLPFPLSDGMRWKASLAGEEVDLLATFNRLPWTEHPQGSYTIVGERGGEKVVEAEYLPADGWYSYIEFGNGDLMVFDHPMHNWAGPLYRATAQRMLTLDPPATPAFGSFVMDAGQTAVAIQAVATGSQPGGAWLVEGPNGTYGSEDLLVEPTNTLAWGHPDAGPWRGVTTPSSDRFSHYAITVTEVALTGFTFG